MQLPDILSFFSSSKVFTFQRYFLVINLLQTCEMSGKIMEGLMLNWSQAHKSLASSTNCFGVQSRMLFFFLHFQLAPKVWLIVLIDLVKSYKNYNSMCPNISEISKRNSFASSFIMGICTKFLYV